jgi:hypothetical protein
MAITLMSRPARIAGIMRVSPKWDVLRTPKRNMVCAS